MNINSPALPGVLDTRRSLAFRLRAYSIPPMLTVTFSLLAMFLLFGLAILHANGGHFAYTQDAPYTHLALADQISHGTYGLNPGEPAAPSSTILYPLMLVPLLGLGQYGPGLLCIMATLGSGLAVCALADACDIRLRRMHPLYLAAITVAFSIAFNIVGVALTGLEHSLHAMLTILSLLGLVRFMQRGRSDWWWLATIILLPLVRFESMSAVLTDAFVLFMFGKRAYAAGVLVAGFLLVVAFALFLHAQGLPYLPTSVTARSQVVSNGLGMQAQHGILGFLASIAKSLKRNLLAFGASQIVLLMVLAGWSLLPFLTASANRLRGIAWPDTDPAPVAAVRFITPAAAGFFILIASAQLLAGSLDSVGGRYEVYVFALGGCTLMVCYRQRVAAFVETMRLGGCIAVCLSALLLFAGYVFRNMDDIQATHTLYAGSFQIRRFITDYYRHDFAVTRPGLVTFHDRHYMLDLSGLSSISVQQAFRQHAPGDVEWMNPLVARHGIGLAIAYTDSQLAHAPSGWTPLAELGGSHKPIAIFYAVRPQDVMPILGCLHRLSHHLVANSDLRFIDPDKTPADACDPKRP